MTTSRSLLLVSLAAGSLTVPAPAASAATEPAIRAITVRPAQPVVGAHGSVRLVIDVIARGVRGKDGVTVKVEPGAPPAGAPQPRPATPPVTAPQNPAPPAQTGTPVTPPGDTETPEQDEPEEAVQQPPQQPPQQEAQEETQEAAQEAAQGTAQSDAQSPARSDAQAGTQTGTQTGTQPGAQADAQVPVKAPPALAPGRQPAQQHAITPARATQTPATAQAGVRPPAQQPASQQHVMNPQPVQVGVTAPKVGVQPQTGEVIPPRLVWRRIPVPPARMADGWETWRFLPDKRLNRYYPAGTWTITATAKGKDGKTAVQYASFELKRESRLSSVRAEKSARGDGVRLRGSLTRVDPRGLTDYGPFAKQRLEILWRPDTTSAWEKAGQATTDASGAFVQTVQGRTGGYWRVRYTGTGHYAPDTSKAHQIAQ
ncbi:hypothetical protein AB0K12_43170 [Nonomuraea sp. NPDC049419]|uniref:hypothetical protein n=1 Tax=Nonomuraea sp. NPDC049419 TaxID=3155772 RepID=UPI003417DD44